MNKWGYPQNRKPDGRMNLPFGRVFRLSPHGGAGISCDQTGITLGGVPLVRISANSLRSQVRTVEQLSAIVRLAYGPQSPNVVRRIHRGLTRAAAQLEAGDLARAGIEAVSIGFPDLARSSLASLTQLSELEKVGTAWQNEPRVPAGQPEGGQWTTGESSGSRDATSSDRPSSTSRPAGADRRLPLLDDGVYHPATDRPAAVSVGGPEDANEGFRTGIGGNEPPDDFMELSELFPGLRNEPGIAIPLAPLDNFLGISSVANQANLAATEAEFDRLYDEIRAIDPSYRFDSFQSLAEMDWEGRANTIKELLLQRAAAYYRVRGDIRPLQVETLRFLQGAVDAAYEQALQEYNNGQLKAPATALSR
jgi:hypothetical protein